MKITIETERPESDPKEAITGWAIDHLRGEGFHVFLPKHLVWETPTAAGARLKCHPFTVTRRIHRWEQMQRSLPVRVGPSGRIIEFLSDPVFDDFVREGLQGQ